MKPMLILLAACAAMGVAAPAGAEPDTADQPAVEQGAENAAFVASLRAAGITYSSPDQVISAGRAVCGLVDRGEPALQVIADLKSHNPGFSTDSAAAFAAIAANTYCPHQLVKK